MKAEGKLLPANSALDLAKTRSNEPDVELPGVEAGTTAPDGGATGGGDQLDQVASGTAPKTPARRGIFSSLMSPLLLSGQEYDEEEEEEDPLAAPGVTFKPGGVAVQAPKSPRTIAKEAAEAKDGADEDGAGNKPCRRGGQKASEVHEDNVEALTLKLEQAMRMRSHFHRDRSQKFPIVTWAWDDGAEQTTYITIRVELLGTVRARDIHARTVLGKQVEIFIDFPHGGELTNPDHLLALNQDLADFNENHPQYTVLGMGHRHLNDAMQEEEVDDQVRLKIDLPFECEEDFINPFGNEDDTGIDVGMFPLDPSKYPRIPGAPVPSCKLLHISLEQKKKKRVNQRAVERSYFSA